MTLRDRLPTPSRSKRWLGIALALTVCLLLSVNGCQPGSPQIHSPAHESAVPSSGQVLVEISIGAPLAPGGQVEVTLLAGIDTPPAQVLLLSDPAANRVQVSGWMATTQLGPADLAEGRNTLVARIDRDGDGAPEDTVSSTFSWEPRLDFSGEEECDFFDRHRCFFPFPSNHFTRPDAATDTGLRVSFPMSGMPANAGGTLVDPTEFNRNDGFSPGPSIMTVVPGLDLAASGAAPIDDIGASVNDPDTAVVLVRASTGERQLLWAELDSGAPASEDPTLLIRPGINLHDGERYIVALRHLRDAAGELLLPERSFQIYRDGIPTYQPIIEDRRAAMESLFERLDDVGVERSELYLAWDFTVISTRSLSERMIHMRDEAFESLAGGAPAFHIDSVTENPYPQLFRQIEGRIEVPLYVTKGGAPGARLHPAPVAGGPALDPDRLPQRVEDASGNPLFYEAKFRCIVPNAAVMTEWGVLYANPARPSIYGHGLLGSRREVRSSHNRDFADEHGFLSCATDWIGMAEDDFNHFIFTIVPDFSNFPTVPDRMQQGFLNTLFLARLLVHEEGFASHCAFQAVAWAPAPGDPCPAGGDPLFDGSELFYDGNSQGGIAGGAVTAFAQDWTRTVLGVTGMNYSTLLHRSIDFEPFNLILTGVYPQRLDQLLGIGLIQMLWDRTETSGHARHLTQDPYPGTPDHLILMHIAYGDHQVAPVSAEVEARTLGASIHLPARATAGPTEVEPYFGIPVIEEYPFRGSAIVIWDSGTATPPLGNIHPTLGQDPHETPRRDAKAKQQKSDFLQSDGAVTDVCGGLACTAVDP
ncbi:MAG: hypothetical protein CL910_00100 [Deltaproteobacteria bacterium]|nr:hypothetical protein [Deltaproteobacteria bacterium]